MGLFNFMDDRMGLISNMLSVTDANLSLLSPNLLDDQSRRATFRCMSCTNVKERKQWLSAGHCHEAAPGFCRNADMINNIRN